MIYIDFQGGQHGNYLEFVCNKFIADVPTTSSTPFSKTGSSHVKTYQTEPVFKAWHYFDYEGKCTIPESGKLVSIRITPDDLLPLMSISLLRSSDYGYDNDSLEVDTYGKLHVRHYYSMLDDIVRGFFKNQIKQSYDAVKDPSWPNISTMLEFLALPEWIQTECRDVHNLELLELSAESPDCPRWVLREFFKLSFQTPTNAGFMRNQEKMIYPTEVDVYNFPFSSFYIPQLFSYQISKIARWAGYPVNVDQEHLLDVHQQFLERQPYKYAKTEADDVVKRIISGEDFSLSSLDLLKESYVSAKLEQYYNSELPQGPDAWPSTSQQLREILVERRY